MYAWTFLDGRPITSSGQSLLYPEPLPLGFLEAFTLDSARYHLNPAFDDSSPMASKNTMVWGFFLVGVVVGFVAVYLLVAQPMYAQLGQMQRQVAALDADIQSLAGVRHEAWEAGNLLSDLKGLKSQIHDARATVRDIRALRQDLLEESRHTAAASNALGSLARLQEFALDQQDLINPAIRSLEQLAQIQKRLVVEHAGTPRAEETLADLDRVRHDLTELLALKAQIAANGAGLDRARSTAGELLSLKDQIVANGHDTEEARTSANRLFVLQEQLKAQGAEIPDAFSSLDQLVEIKEKLVEQTPAVADAVQNLEILTDFQEEFGEQIRALGQMREQLIQIVLMEGALGRLAKMLEPLSQIANIRRLGDRELREAARSILENRSTRISSKPDATRHLPRDPVTLPSDLSRDDFSEEAETGEVPAPVPLPITTN
jgi:hypothetical protein